MTQYELERERDVLEAFIDRFEARGDDVEGEKEELAHIVSLIESLVEAAQG